MALIVRGRPLSPMRVAAWLIASLPFLLCAYIYAAYNAGRAELRALCEKDFEPRVYKQASAEGYFDSTEFCFGPGCWTILTERPYRFIEIQQRGAKSYHALPEDGYYRLTKVKQDSGLCDPRILEDLRKAFVYKKFYAEGNCIQLERIEKPTAQFGLFVEPISEIPVRNWFGSGVRGSFAQIRDIWHSEVVAEATSYRLYQRTFPSFSSFAPIKTCSDVGVNLSRPFVSKIAAYVEPI